MNISDRPSACPHLYAVDAAKPFVDVLARFLLDAYDDGEAGLSRVLLLVPTRRSIPAVRQALLAASGGRPLLLPRVEALGDVDLARLIPSRLLADEEGAALLGLRVLPSRHRTLELARLIDEARDRMGEAALFTPDQAVTMALSLGDLIDDLEREGIAFDALTHLPPEEYAAHWQKTLAFLEIAGVYWPEVQKSLGGIDAVAHRNRMLALLADEWRARPPDHPVVIAGTTGSIPATAALIGIAGLEHGRVLLPGLDLDCDDEEWAAIGQSVSHAQHGLWRLLQALGCSRATIRRLSTDAVRGASGERMRFLSAALAPPAFADGWRRSGLSPQSALRDFTLTEFADDAEEAAGIALMLRDALEDPAKTAMLVTHDRDLARRVVIALRRFGIEAEDGGGTRLLETRPAALLFHVLSVAQNGAAPVPLLSLLKHPLCGLDMPIDERLGAVARLEKVLLRGVRVAGELDALLALAGKDEALVETALPLLHRLALALSPLAAAFGQGRQPLGVMLDALIAAAEAVAQLPGAPGPNLLWAGRDGELLSRTLAEIGRHAEAIGPVAPAALPGILSSLLSRETYHPPRRGHPRLAVLSPSEARLQHADRVIMAGLNEECWPPAAPSDPWMNRLMREAAGLPPHERLIGLSAHDFFSLAAAPEVMLTRARKAGETPRLASRWWQRLLTVAEATGAPDLLRREEAVRWPRWVAEEGRAESISRLGRPSPTPPAADRPTRFTASDIERLLSDPYAYYAQRILRLRPLDAIDKPPGPSEFGTAIHAALATFFADGAMEICEAAVERLEALLERALRRSLRQEGLPPFWQQRIGAIAREVMKGEAERADKIMVRMGERPLAAELGGEGRRFTLEARADRIDRRKDGFHDIIDYKTGAAPSPSDVAQGQKPQLPLEAVLLEAEGLAVGDLLYWSFSTDRAKRGIRPAGGIDPAALTDAARRGVTALTGHFAAGTSPYPSLADDEDRIDDYAPLARKSEWA